MISLEELYSIGKLRKPHGKRGEILLTADNDVLDMVEPRWLVLALDGIFVPFGIEEVRSKGMDYIISLSDIDTEEKAQRLCPTQCYLLRRELPDGINEQESLTDLVGYSVYNESKHMVGTIVQIDDTTENILLLLHNDIVLPFHDDLVLELDTEQHNLVMSVPQGL